MGSVMTFRSVYQPVVDLTTMTSVGHEALTRFEDGRSPLIHLQETEEPELLERAMASMAVQESPFQHGWLSVNFSPGTIHSYPELVHSLQGRLSIPLVVEITETMGVNDYKEILRSCRGIPLSIDDFGAEFATFRHVVELSPRFLKIDRYLISGIDSDHWKQHIVSSIAYLARLEGVQVIAEGIETQAECLVTASLGVGLGQGYYLGPPTSFSLDTLKSGVIQYDTRNNNRSVTPCERPSVS